MRQSWADRPHRRIRMMSHGVLAGLCGVLVAGMTPAGSAAAAPSTAQVGCGAVLTSNTQLTADLSCGAGDALVVGADNIVVDLNGHTISGPGSFVPGAGVRIAFHREATVRGGTIRGFSEGVVLDTASANHVTNLVLTTNLRGVNLAISTENLIERNRISGSGLDGIRLGLSSRNRVTGNVLADNVFGIGVADQSNFNLINRNTVLRTREFGISMFSDSDRNVVSRNTVSDGVTDGITATLGSDNTLFHRNRVSRQGRDGILVDASGTGSVFLENTASYNSDDGIDVDNTLAILTDNTTNQNGDLGIEAVNGVIDGGGNTATGNGNPAQCTGVTCQ